MTHALSRLIRTALLFAAIVRVIDIPAQPETILWQHLMTTEAETVEAIALYPAAERSYIVEAALHPEVLARIDALQQTSSNRFRQLIDQLPQEEQLRMYNVSRYPELLNTWVEINEKDGKDWEQVLADYPASVQADFKWVVSGYPEIVSAIHALLQASEEQIALLLAGESPAVREAFTRILQLPELMTLLTTHLSATILLGDIYRQDGAALEMRLDSLQRAIAVRKAEELVQWQQELAGDSAALTELEQAAESFAGEQGIATASDYDMEVYTYREIDLVWRPYTYWTGWPYWYSYMYWYPYPWYHYGFYYLPNRTIVFVGLPSYAFLYWCLYDFNHFYYYPHLTNRLLLYTERHPEASNTVASAVTGWRAQLATEVPAAWLANDGSRTDRIRQYGAFKMDYSAAVASKVNNAPSEVEYLSRHVARYPALRQVLPYRQAGLEADRQVAEPVRESAIPSRTPDSRTIVPEPSIRSRRTEPIIQIDRAIRYHDYRWNRVPQPVFTPTPPTSRPPTPRVQPAPPVISPRRNIGD